MRGLLVLVAPLLLFSNPTLAAGHHKQIVCHATIESANLPKEAFDLKGESTNSPSVRFLEGDSSNGLYRFSTTDFGHGDIGALSIYKRRSAEKEDGCYDLVAISDGRLGLDGRIMLAFMDHSEREVKTLGLVCFYK